MAEERFKRKLTAILSADVAGYSRLMAEDETSTVKTLADYREVIASLTKQHHGRVVDSPGDNILAEFASVVDAVQCAVAVQKELETRNADLDENRRMEFRIGINLGDVIDEKERIYGDGVNIAARLEALSDPGGICISKTAFDQIETKLPLGYEFLGEQEVKNIPKPVPAYRVLMNADAAGKVIGKYRSRTTQLRWTATGGLIVLMLVVGVWAIWNFYFRPASTPSLELPDHPSIAVLPFKNLSGDPNQEYFSDGLAADIITQLYKMPNMYVIAPQSSFRYKNKAVKVQQVGEELGVRYVLEGSVQQAEGRIRINIHLTEAETGNQVWAERYDREKEDLFAVQDEITRKVVTETAGEISMGEMAHLMGRTTENYDALDYYFKAYNFFRRFEKESNARVRGLLEKAIELDPKYVHAIALMGYTHLMDARAGWVENRTESIKQANELANRALELNDKVATVHQLLGSIYQLKGDNDQALTAKKRAMVCEPNNAVVINSYANALIFAGTPEEALELSRKAMRSFPYPPKYILETAGMVNYFTGRYEASIIEFKKRIKRFPGRSPLETWPWVIASYMELGREKEAKSEVRKLIEKHPNFFIDAYIKKERLRPYKDHAFLDRQAELLRKAGLK